MVTSAGIVLAPNDRLLLEDIRSRACKAAARKYARLHLGLTDTMAGREYTGIMKQAKNVARETGRFYALFLFRGNLSGRRPWYPSKQIHDFMQCEDMDNGFIRAMKSLFDTWNCQMYGETYRTDEEAVESYNRTRSLLNQFFPDMDADSKALWPDPA